MCNSIKRKTQLCGQHKNPVTCVPSVRSQGQLCAPRHKVASGVQGKGHMASNTQILSTARPDKAKENDPTKGSVTLRHRAPALTLML